MTDKITEDEFEAQYAKLLGLTVKELHDLGGYVKLCDCEYEGCEGWQMMFDVGIPYGYSNEQ